MMPHWYLYEPRISEGFSLPVGDINWFADESVPAPLQEGLMLASQEWRRVMGCSFTPHKQKSPENMHIHFSCPSDFPPVFGPGSRANLQVDDAGVVHVTLRDDYCKHGRESVAQYAWSHALGFEEKFNLLAPVMSGLYATVETLDGLGPYHIGVESWTVFASGRSRKVQWAARRENQTGAGLITHRAIITRTQQKQMSKHGSQ